MTEYRLQRAVEIAFGGRLRVVASRSVGGGCISDARLVELSDGNGRFVKLHSLDVPDLFEREAEGLRALDATGAIRVPRGATAGRLEDRQFLILEAIETGAPGPGFFGDFGRRFAALHRDSAADRFGFPHDNYIGATPQPNGWLDDWPEFFRRRRLGHQIETARRRGSGTSELYRLADRLLSRLDDWLNVPGEPACLLHGDLWSGNYMVDESGGPVLIDPACYYGHREADLAMTQLFGGFGAEFYAAYGASWPLPEGSARRLEIYKLYHLLNHLNLFGGSYLGRCVSLLKGLV